MPDITVVGFDLDDTLLRLDPEFVPEYVQRLSTHLADRFPDKTGLHEALQAVSLMMMDKPRDQEWLEDFFYRVFEIRTGLSRNDLEPYLGEFYRGEFPLLQRLSRPVYGAMGVLSTVRSQGYRVALLTSALFPQEAINQRLYWAGLEEFPFDWRTSLEVVHCTKPQPDYYREAAEALGSYPHEWLMVGNDLVEDIISAHQAGMAVYWVHGPVTSDERDVLPPNTPVGPLERLVAWLSHHV